MYVRHLQFFHLYYTLLTLRGLISRTRAAKRQSSTADSFLPIRSPENQGVVHLLTASEIHKGKKNTDALKTIALIIDELQHVAISFQHSTASLPSVLPPEMLRRAGHRALCSNTGKCKELCKSEMGMAICVPSPMFSFNSESNKKRRLKQSCFHAPLRKPSKHRDSHVITGKVQAMRWSKSQVILSFTIYRSKQQGSQMPES